PERPPRRSRRRHGQTHHPRRRHRRGGAGLDLRASRTARASPQRRRPLPAGAAITDNHEAREEPLTMTIVVNETIPVISAAKYTAGAGAVADYKSGGGVGLAVRNASSNSIGVITC